MSAPGSPPSEPTGEPSLTEQCRHLAAGEVSSVALVEAALTRAEATSDLNVLVGLRPEAALADAAAADARRQRGDTRSRLDGVPMILKDNMVKRGEPSTCASRQLRTRMLPRRSFSTSPGGTMLNSS